jgi:hypothetical protein
MPRWWMQYNTLGVWSEVWQPFNMPIKEQYKLHVGMHRTNTTRELKGVSSKPLEPSRQNVTAIDGDGH